MRHATEYIFFASSYNFFLNKRDTTQPLEYYYETKPHD